MWFTITGPLEHIAPTRAEPTVPLPQLVNAQKTGGTVVVAPAGSPKVRFEALFALGEAAPQVAWGSAAQRFMDPRGHVRVRRADPAARVPTLIQDGAGGYHDGLALVWAGTQRPAGHDGDGPGCSFASAVPCWLAGLA